jgi:hypothetical protein
LEEGEAAWAIVLRAERGGKRGSARDVVEDGDVEGVPESEVDEEDEEEGEAGESAEGECADDSAAERLCEWF